MNTVNELMAQLDALGIRLAVDGEQLRVNAPKGRLTPDLQAELLHHKADILALLGQQGAKPDSGYASIRPATRDGPLPASFAQQRLWFLDRFEPNSSAYNVPSAYRLVGHLDVNALEQAINEVIRRHEILRTTFSDVDGKPVQTITPTLRVPLRVTDLQSLPEAEREAEALRLAVNGVRVPFDLGQGPLLRAQLLRLGVEEHFLVLTLHHIVTDGWSVGVLRRELADLYDAFGQGRPSKLPELAIQYADYAIWQRDRLRGEVLEQQVAFWKQKLDGAPVLALPTEHPRPAIQSHRGAQHSVELSTGLTIEIRALSRDQNATPFMVLLAAFKVLLQRCAGQDDIVVGAPVAGRTRTEIEDLIGFFVNSLVLRTDLSGDPTFPDLLGRVRGVCIEAFTHQEVPFEKLLDELRVERDQSRTPLFQVFFNMLDRESLDLSFPGIAVERLILPKVESNFDLTVYAWEKAGRLALRFSYCSDLFTPARIEEMAAQYLHLLEQIAANPEQRISQLDLLTPSAEKVLPDPKRFLPAEWQGTIHARVAHHARQTPRRMALVDPQGSYTYEELDRHSSQIANYLIEKGIQPGDRVAVWAHRSASLVWAVLGIQRAGAAFLILDGAYPESRLIRYLSMAQPRGWIQLEAAGALPQAVSEFLTTSGCCFQLVLPGDPTANEGGPLAGYSDREPEVPTGPDDPACVVFTSGSTGKPKGVLGRHGSLTQFEPWRQEQFGLTDRDRFAMLSGLAYSPLQRDIFTPLWTGATLLIPDGETLRTPGQLALWMARQRITVAGLTPAMASSLFSTAPAGVSLPDLRHAFFGGDRLSRRDVASLRRLAPNVTCTNTYGTTETQRADSCYVIPGMPEGNEGKDLYPLGRGMPGVQLLVLNGNGKLAGVGEIGEICVRSPHIALGFLGDDALTNRFSGLEGDRLFRTGDLGRYRPDGDVDFYGRADRQLKIRGFRIEPGEVETALVEHPQVRAAAVTLWDDCPGGAGLAAYLETNGNRTLTGEQLRPFLKRRLPDYMLPVSYSCVRALPLTPHGKIDFAALPEPMAVAAGVSGPVAPRSQVERQLVMIWEQLLDSQPIGIRDNFFDLGGHSLLSIRLLASIESAFGMKLPVALLFQAPTIEQLAPHLRPGRTQTAPRLASVVAMNPSGIRTPLFFAPGSMGNVFTHLGHLARCLGPEQPFYGLQETTGDPIKIESIAARFLAEVRTVQPAGPYLLGGLCHGSVVVFEMAQQLRALGQHVAFLALVEPGYWRSRGPEAYARLATKVLGQAPGRLGRYLRRASSAAGTGQSDYVRQKARLVANALATIRYEPRAYLGRLDLFLTAESLPRPDDGAAGWQRVARGSMHIHEIPGDHALLVGADEMPIDKASMRAVAQGIRACLDEILDTTVALPTSRSWMSGGL